MPLSRVVLEAPAKINLYLAVGARRADGYHDVTTVLQTVDLCDEVVVEPAERLSVRCAPDVGVAAEDNLAARAARVLAEATGRTPDVSVTLAKRIPARAGLGGGSADAAAVAVALRELWELGEDFDLVTPCRLLGADVPFFLEGAAALYEGRGDELSRRPPTVPLRLVLVNAGIGISTTDAYAAFDRLPFGTSPGPDAVIDALESASADRVAAALFNNMTESSAGMAPFVGEGLALLTASEGCLGCAMAGSGSSVFGICADEPAAEYAAAQARARGWWAATTMTRGCGARVVRREARDT